MFRRLARGYAEDLVLVRGWGFDNRIFADLDLPYNYIFYEGPHVWTLAMELLDWLDQSGTDSVTLFGWSMGAYVASDFARAHPERVRGLWLVGARQYYREEDVAVVRHALGRNPRGFLRKFYKDCFAGHDMALYRRFKQTLQANYIAAGDIEALNADLDWLCARQLDLTAVDPNIEVLLIHGLNDGIVPLAEAQDLSQRLPCARLVFLPQAGHLPFLVPDFWARVHAES
jgi:pimeloyl-ACP methyl ester carboxylesterase